MKALKRTGRRLTALLLSISLMAGLLLTAAAESYYFTSPYVDGVVYELPSEPDEIAYGIDVSYYQSEINWAAVAADGIEFALIRGAVRYSGSGTLAVDSKFYDNIEGALENGIKVGVYIFSQATTVEEAIEEAEFLIDIVEGYDIDLPLVYDPEFLTSSTTGEHYGRLYEAYAALDTADRVNFLTELGNAFAVTVEEAGYVAMYYSSYYWLKNSVDTTTFSSPVWLARYNTYTGYSDISDIAFWQYSSSGTVEGISTLVDLNVCVNTAYLDCQTIVDSRTEPDSSAITIEATAYPTGTIEAATFNLEGTITSNYPLVSVTGTITSTDGTVVQTFTAQPYTCFFDLSGSRVDLNLQFGSLEGGEYRLTYTATDTEGVTATWTSEAFTVTAAVSDSTDTDDAATTEGDTDSDLLTITATAYPTGNISASAFTLQGTITSENTLSRVTGSIVSADGTVVQTVTQTNIGSTTFEIQSSDVDNGLKFGNLSGGYYYINYTAVDTEGNSKTWTSPVFAVSPTTLFTDVTDSSKWYFSTVYNMTTRGYFTGYTEGETVYFAPEQEISRIEVIVLLYRLAGSPEVTGTHPFEDATASWYQDALIWAYQNGIAQGTSETSFDPSASITREAYATLLYRYVGADEEESVLSEEEEEEAEATDAEETKEDVNDETGTEETEEDATDETGTEETEEDVTDETGTEETEEDVTEEAGTEEEDLTEEADTEETDYLADYTDVDEVSDWALDAVAWAVANGVINSTSTTSKDLSPTLSTTRAVAAQLMYNFAAAFLT